MLGKKDTSVNKTHLLPSGPRPRGMQASQAIQSLSSGASAVTARERHSPVTLEWRRWSLEIPEPAGEGSRVRTESTGMGRDPLQRQ